MGAASSSAATVLGIAMSLTAAEPTELTPRDCQEALASLQERMARMDDVELAVARMRHVPFYATRCARTRRLDKDWRIASILLDLEARRRGLSLFPPSPPPLAPR